VPRPKNNRETDGIRRMIHQHLRRNALVAPAISASSHLDEDALSAFTEGRLTEAESKPVVKHLVACTFCRHITAQLVRLDSEVGATVPGSAPTEEEPGRIRRVLKDLASRLVVPSDEGAVFAYHAPADDFTPNDDDTHAVEEKPETAGTADQTPDVESNDKS
jgi:hypothetical protein